MCTHSKWAKEETLKQSQSKKAMHAVNFDTQVFYLGESIFYLHTNEGEPNGFLSNDK